MASKLTKPFEVGWGREIVFRHRDDDSCSSKYADVYYFSPEGSKLVSVYMCICVIFLHSQFLIFDMNDKINLTSI